MSGSESGSISTYVAVMAQEPRSDWGTDKTRGWREYFGQQAIVNVSENVAVLAKSSEISPTGGMVMRFDVGSPTELLVSQAAEVFRVAGKMAEAEQRMYPDNQITYVQYNYSGSEVPFQKPEQLGPYPKDKSKVTSQTILPWHVHVDTRKDLGVAITPGEGVYSTIVAVQGVETGAKTARSVAREIRPNLGVQMAVAMWDAEIMPELVSKYPDMFETMEGKRRADGSRDLDQFPWEPGAAIELKQGFAAMQDERFTQAVLDIHERTVKEWKRLVGIVKRLKSDPSLGEMELKRLLDEKPELKPFEGGIRMYAKVIKDRADVAQEKWLNEEPNFTVFVSAKNGEKVFLSVHPNPLGKTGSQSGGFVSVRDASRFADAEEVQIRRDFRGRLAKELTSVISGSSIGSEGEKSLTEMNVK